LLKANLLRRAVRKRPWHLLLQHGNDQERVEVDLNLVDVDQESNLE
jgi:hypothetical protein